MGDMDITVFVQSYITGSVHVWARGKDAVQATGIGIFADEGIAIFPQRYDAFGAIVAWVENQLIRGHLSIAQRAEIQGLLGSPWPHKKLTFTWSETHDKEETTT